MNDNEIQFSADADPRVTDTLRALYAAPAEPSYWQALESRVLNRIAAAERNGWWQVAAGWARPGLAAAAVLLAIAGAAAALGQRDGSEQIVAYEAFAPVTDQDETVAIYTEADLTTQREATLRLVVSH